MPSVVDIQSDLCVWPTVGFPCLAEFVSNMEASTEVGFFFYFFCYYYYYFVGFVVVLLLFCEGSTCQAAATHKACRGCLFWQMLLLLIKYFHCSFYE